MALLILLVLFGGVMSYFATLNTNLASLQFGYFSLDNVPIYLIVLGSMFVGLVFAWIIHLVGGVSSTVHLWRKDKTIAATQSTVRDLEKRNQELELENTKLRTEYKYAEPHAFASRVSAVK